MAEPGVTDRAPAPGGSPAPGATSKPAAVEPDAARRVDDLLERFRARVVARDWRAAGALLGDARTWRFDHEETAAGFTDGLREHLGDALDLSFEYVESAPPRRFGELVVARREARLSWTEPYFVARRDWRIGMVLAVAAEAGELRPTYLSLARDAKVHAACGPGDFFPRLLQGWVNLDQRYRHPDFGRVDLLAEWPFGDGAAAAVYSEDFIEHLDQRQQLLFLGEARRVLQPGGLVRIVCPALCEESVRRLFPAWPETGIRHADLAVEWPQWGHVLMPTREYLARVLELVGLVDLRWLDKGESGIPGFPGDMRPLDDRRQEDELYVEAMKPLP